MAIPYKSGVAVASSLIDSINSPKRSRLLLKTIAAAKNHTILAGVQMASRLGWVLVNAWDC